MNKAFNEEISRRRMNRIELIEENVPDICWTELVMWALFNREINTIGGKKCFDEAAQTGSCYCGKYNEWQNDDE
jgi:hypothetical protein